LADGIGFWPAVILESIGFGALHYFTKPFERWEDWFAVTLITIFITLALRRTGSLAFPSACTPPLTSLSSIFFGNEWRRIRGRRLLNAQFPGPEPADRRIAGTRG